MSRIYGAAAPRGCYPSQGFHSSKESIIFWDHLLVSHLYHLYENKQKLQAEPIIPGIEWGLASIFLRWFRQRNIQKPLEYFSWGLLWEQIIWRWITSI